MGLRLTTHDDDAVQKYGTQSAMVQKDLNLTTSGGAAKLMVFVATLTAMPGVARAQQSCVRPADTSAYSVQNAPSLGLPDLGLPDLGLLGVTPATPVPLESISCAAGHVGVTMTTGLRNSYQRYMYRHPYDGDLAANGLICNYTTIPPQLSIWGVDVGYCFCV